MGISGLGVSDIKLVGWGELNILGGSLYTAKSINITVDVD